jgi:hypothetical protein
MPDRVATAVSILLLVSALLTFQPLARAAEPVHAPAKGSTDWSTVREAVRQISMRRYKAGLTVEMHSLRVQDEWVFMRTFHLSPPNPELEQRLYPDTAALLTKQGGGWKVLLWGRTCLPVDCMIAKVGEAQKEYPQAPASIFPAGIAEWRALQEALGQVVVQDYKSPRRVHRSGTNPRRLGVAKWP